MKALEAIFKAIISFITALFAKKEIPASQETGSKEQQLELPTYLPLAWEKDHPEREPWSIYTLKRSEELWPSLSKVKDMTYFRSDWHELTKREQINVFGEFIAWLAYYESAWNPKSSSTDVGEEGDVNTHSRGLLQVSQVDQANYKVWPLMKDGKKFSYSASDLLEPMNNIDLGLMLLACLIEKDGLLRRKRGNWITWATLAPGNQYDKSAAIAAKTNAFPIKANRKPAKTPQEPTNTPLKSREELLRGLLVKEVRQDLGQRETHGKNRSPLIDTINDFTHGGLAAPYCISALVYRVHMLCKRLNLVCPVPRECSTQNFWNNAPSKYKKPKGVLAEESDLGIQQTRTDIYRGHAYMFRINQVDKTHYTIEANTDGSGGRDGDGWYERVRNDDGDSSKKYLGSVDIAQWILDANPDWKG